MTAKFTDSAQWVVNKTRNGTEWKKLIKHGTELLSRHKARLYARMAHGATPTQTVRARLRGERG